MRFQALAFASLFVVAFGCKEESAAPTAPSSASASTAVTPPPVTPPGASSAPAASAPAASHPSPLSAVPAERTCEVEIFGEVKVPKTVPEKSRIVVYVAQDDCMADNAQMLGHVVIANGTTGSFFIEVFPKWGSDVSICAAVDNGPNKPSEMYVKASGKFHAEAEGEVTFNNVKMELAPGKPHTFPPDRKK